MNIFPINNKFKLLMCTLLTASAFFALSFILMFDYSVKLYSLGVFGWCFILALLGVFLFCTGLYFASSFIDRLIAIIRSKEESHV